MSTRGVLKAIGTGHQWETLFAAVDKRADRAFGRTIPTYNGAQIEHRPVVDLMILFGDNGIDELLH